MKKLTAVCLVGTMFLSSNAFAGFGSLSGLASQLTETATGVSPNNMDLAGFLKQASATNQMFSQSCTCLATLFAERKDAEQLKTKLNKRLIWNFFQKKIR